MEKLAKTEYNAAEINYFFDILMLCRPLSFCSPKLSSGLNLSKLRFKSDPNISAYSLTISIELCPKILFNLKISPPFKIQFLANV